MRHSRITVASNEEYDLALEECECGEYSLSMGPVTVHLEGDTLEALVRMLHRAVVGGDDSNMPITMPNPSDIQ